MKRHIPQPAQSLYLFQVLAILLCALLVQSSSSPSPKNNYPGLKYRHLTFYEHDTLNKTSYLIVNGVTGPGITSTTSPFGSLFANQDPLTVTPDRSSEVVGIAEGYSVTCNFNGLTNILVQKITFLLKDLKGSINIIGNGDSISHSEIPIAGGTGDFLFVQGYVTSTLIDVKGYYLLYKADFHIYWPPYANHASLHV